MMETLRKLVLIAEMQGGNLEIQLISEFTHKEFNKNKSSSVGLNSILNNVSLKLAS